MLTATAPKRILNHGSTWRSGPGTRYGAPNQAQRYEEHSTARRNRRSGRVTAEYAEYAERKQASGWISAYFAYSAVQPHSGKSSQPASKLDDCSAEGTGAA